MIIKRKMCSHRVFANFRKFTPPQASQLHGENAPILLQQLEKGFQKNHKLHFQIAQYSYKTSIYVVKPLWSQVLALSASL